MKHSIIICSLLSLFTAHSCTKKDSKGNNCYPMRQTFRHIDHVEASISEVNGAYFIIEKSTIDLRLRPCNLSDAFKVNNLAVIVSGDHKFTDQSGPCCTDDFVITDIKKN